MPFAPDLWFVARQAADIVGFCLGSRRTEQDGTVGYVSDVGVRPAWRGQGIAFALLTTCLARFATDGLSTATLNVDAENLTGALRLYRKAGMHPTPLSTEWSKPVLTINF
jgi:ribosomal protein S18 acetylase RimI-like enzyme